jgi:hypothetical protein
MPLRNHNRVFRPVRAGIEIRNTTLLEPGTIGLIATSNGADRWIVSCHHVLCTANFPEQIVQPFGAANVIAMSDAARSRADLDCAAASIVAGVQVIAEVLGIGRLGEPVDPTVGMEVVKSGAATGVTEGTIRSITPGRVEIRPLKLPDDYQLSDGGDSGAVWIEKNTFSPVVLHQGSTSEGFAIGRPIKEVLAALNLRMVRIAAAGGGGQ